MFLRLKQFVTAFAAVGIVYLAYSLLVVRFIEPSVREREAVGDETVYSSADSPREMQLRSIFPPGSWELDQPKVLETDRGMLLLREMREVDEYHLELEPCTLLFFPEDGEDQERYVVLQAAKSAVLTFAEPLNLARGQIGRLVSGQLLGAVTIRSPESSPGKGDPLEIQTDNVQLTEERIEAPNQVRFAYGKNSGSGRDLIITLDPTSSRRPARAGKDKGSKTDQIKIGSFKSLELVHVDQIQLQVDNPREDTEATGQPDKPRPPEQMDVRVTCDGPFLFDFEDKTASFRDNVRVLRANLDAANDELICERLAAYFVEGDKKGNGSAANKTAGQSELSGLEIERIEAVGSPVDLRAPSYSASIRAESLEYNFKTGKVEIEDSNKALLRYKENSVETPRIEYQVGEDGRLGQLQADGPGRLYGSLPDDPTKTFEAVWNDRVVLQPHQGDHALSLLSGAAFRYNSVGEFKADNVHVWIREVPKPQPAGAKPKYEYQPIRMLAENNVRIDSWQLTGAIERAEVWIRYKDPKKKTRPKKKPDTPAPKKQENSLVASSDQRFNVAGRQLQAQLLRAGEQVVVQQLIVDGNVRFRETQTDRPDEIPMAISGDIVQLDQANTPRARVRVQGRPAEVSARGLVLVGGDIQLNRNENRMWIAGPGKMVLPANQPSDDSDTNPLQGLGSSGPVTITWQEKMNFDGLTATFHRDVQVAANQVSPKGELSNLLVQGSVLGVTLTDRVVFTEDKPPPDLGVREMEFDGDVILRNRGSRDGQQTSIEEMRLHDLTIDGATGRLNAPGPGWVSTVRYNDGFSDDAIEPALATSRSDDASLIYVRVDFDGEIAGNANSKEVEFLGRVNTLYGPVTAWDQTLDPDPVTGLTNGQFLVTSDRLTIADMGSPSEYEPSGVGLVADGNATIEGRSFTALGQRISYAKAKELVILEGDGRTDAQLWRKGSRTPDAAAQQIRFWTHNNSIQVNGGRFFNLSNVGSSRGIRQ